MTTTTKTETVQTGRQDAAKIPNVKVTINSADKETPIVIAMNQAAVDALTANLIDKKGHKPWRSLLGNPHAAVSPVGREDALKRCASWIPELRRQWAEVLAKDEEAFRSMRG